MIEEEDPQAVHTISRTRAHSRRGQHRSDPQRSALDILLLPNTSASVRTGSQKISISDALYLKTYNDAVQGDQLACLEVLSWIEKRELARNPLRVRNTTVNFETRSPAHVDKALQILGIASEAPHLTSRDGRVGLLLEPAFVMLALSRNKTATLDAKKIARVKRHTRNLVELCWPEESGHE